MHSNERKFIHYQSAKHDIMVGDDIRMSAKRINIRVTSNHVGISRQSSQIGQSKMIWSCPLCASELRLMGQSMRCDNNHSFDCAKEGYVNLLPAHHKNSKQPGDSGAMIAARRRIHDAELYLPLAEEIITVIEACTNIKTLLDIGCGEGYYDGEISRRFGDIDLYGVDVSKDAIRFASKRYPAHHYAVANALNLPLISGSVDLALRIFAPSNDVEINRVLADDGLYLEVGPAPMHLWELREALYESPREHSTHRREADGMIMLREGQCRYESSLNSNLLEALVSATPFAFKGDRSRRAALLEHDQMTMTMSFDWRLFKKR